MRTWREPTPRWWGRCSRGMYSKTRVVRCPGTDPGGLDGRELVTQGVLVSPSVEWAFVRARGRAVGPLSPGRLPLRVEVSHPQRFLETVPFCPAAPDGRPRWAAPFDLGPLRTAGEDGFLRGPSRLSAHPGWRRGRVLAPDRRRLHHDGTRVPRLTARPGGRGRRFHPVRRRRREGQDAAGVGCAAVRHLCFGRPDLRLQGAGVLRSDALDRVRHRVGVAGLLPAGGRGRAVLAGEAGDAFAP